MYRCCQHHYLWYWIIFGQDPIIAYVWYSNVVWSIYVELSRFVFLTHFELWGGTVMFHYFPKIVFWAVSVVRMTQELGQLWKMFNCWKNVQNLAADLYRFLLKPFFLLCRTAVGVWLPRTPWTRAPSPLGPAPAPAHETLPRWPGNWKLENSVKWFLS